MQLSRRELGRAGVAAFAGAMLIRPAMVLAQEGVSPVLSVAQRLAPIAPELRPAARRMIEGGFGPITAEALLKRGANAGGLTDEVVPNGT